MIQGDLGFSIVLKDTWTCGMEELGIKPLTFQLVDDLLYPLSQTTRKELIKVDHYLKKDRECTINF